MSHQDTVCGDLYDPFCHLIKFGSIAEHLIIDAGKIHHERLNGLFGIHQADELVNNLFPVKLIDGDLGDPLFIILSAGSFYV